MDSKVDQALCMLRARFRMLADLLKCCSTIAPKYILIVPVDPEEPPPTGVKETLWQWAKDPSGILNIKAKLFFLDPIHMQPADTNKGAGFELSFPKAWVAQALPMIASVTGILRSAHSSGVLKLIPGYSLAEGAVTGFFDKQMDMLHSLGDDIKGEAEGGSKGLLSAALGGSDDADNCAGKLVDYAMGQAEAFGGEQLERLGGAVAPSEQKLQQMREPMTKSVNELNRMLTGAKGGGDNWKEASGLVCCTSAKDGTTEWVRPEDEALFMREGKACLWVPSEHPPKPARPDKPTGAADAPETLDTREETAQRYASAEWVGGVIKQVRTGAEGLARDIAGIGAQPAPEARDEDPRIGELEARLGERQLTDGSMAALEQRMMLVDDTARNVDTSLFDLKGAVDTIARAVSQDVGRPGGTPVGEDAPGVLRVFLKSASGLRAADLMGKSDPYVKLSMAGEQTQQSRAVKQNLDPVWNQTFE